MYYGFILLSVVMFGGCFMLNDVHRRLRSSCLKVSLQGSLFSALAGLLVLLIVSGFSLTLTWGSVLISLLAAINSIVLSYCGIMALGSINLSLYSLFMMLGGMMLPFWQGVFFYDEKLTVAKVICFVFICAALLVTVEKSESKKKAVIYYVAIFVLNGMSGVYSKIFVGLGDAATPADYSIALAIWTGILSAVLLFFFFRKKQDDGVPPMTPLSIFVSATSGGINKIANFLLTTALLHVDASVQYPMVTGGVMIVSTATAFLTKNKPKMREILSVAIAFVGLLILFLLPY